MSTFKKIGYIGYAVTGIVCFFTVYYYPHSTMRNLLPYTGSMKGSLDALSFLPVFWPALIVVALACFSLLAQEINFKRNFIFTLWVIMVLSGISNYADAKQFLNSYLVYQGPCTALSAETKGPGTKAQSVINLECGGHTVKAEDPVETEGIINHLISKPNTRLSCTVSASGIPSCQ
jgi:hypothetical protein